MNRAVLLCLAMALVVFLFAPAHARQPHHNWNPELAAAVKSLPVGEVNRCDRNEVALYSGSNVIAGRPYNVEGMKVIAGISTGKNFWALCQYVQATRVLEAVKSATARVMRNGVAKKQMRSVRSLAPRSAPVAERIVKPARPATQTAGRATATRSTASAGEPVALRPAIKDAQAEQPLRARPSLFRLMNQQIEARACANSFAADAKMAESQGLTQAELESRQFADRFAISNDCQPIGRKADAQLAELQQSWAAFFSQAHAAHRRMIEHHRRAHWRKAQRARQAYG